MNRSLTDEDEAKQLAQEISAGQSGVTITIVSSSMEPSGEWTRTVATYLDGKPHPWVWTVTFLGYLEDLDHVWLNKAGISYMGGGSEPGPQGVMRAAVSRHRLAVEAPDGDAAVAKTHEALGGLATEMREWTAEPGDDLAIHFRFEDNPPPDN
jgi:hypothetical protein